MSVHPVLILFFVNSEYFSASFKEFSPPDGEVSQLSEQRQKEEHDYGYGHDNQHQHQQDLDRKQVEAEDADIDFVTDGMYLVRAISDSSHTLKTKATVHHRVGQDMQHDHSHGKAKYAMHISRTSVQILKLSRRRNVRGSSQYTVTFDTGSHGRDSDDNGGLGLELETNISDKERYGVASGRRASGIDFSAVVTGVSGQAEQKGVQLGNYLVEINGQSTLKWTFKKTSTCAWRGIVTQ
jgi:hypothetical protein